MSTESASGALYTRAEQEVYAQLMQSENEGLRRHIDNRTNALDKRVGAIELSQQETIAAAVTAQSLTRAQERIYNELQKITKLVHELNAIDIRNKLSEIQATQQQHGETLQRHDIMLIRHEEDIEDINRKAIADLRTRVTELEKADGKRALKWLGIVATAVIGVLVGGIMSALGIFS